MVGSGLFERVSTPWRLKSNRFWTGDAHDQLAIPINYWIDQIKDCFNLEEDVDKILLYGRLLELKGKPTYRGRDPKRVWLYVQTTDFVGEYENRLKDLLEGGVPPRPCDLNLKVTLDPRPILDQIDWVDRTMQLYP